MDKNRPDFLTPPGTTKDDTSVVAHYDDRALDSPVSQKRNKIMTKHKIPTEALLSKISTICAMLEKGTEPVMDHTGQVIEIPLSRERIAAINSAKESYHRLLAKTMPDLKQVVMTDAAGNVKNFDLKIVVQD